VNTVNSRSNAAAEPAPDGLETDSRWLLVQRILDSRHFARSARLRDFLLYVCRAALEGRGGEISEQQVGERVFERPPGYNPNEDNIVRSQARLLRQRLDAYFADEGATEPLVLRIPKGGYTPEFVERVIELPPQPAAETGRPLGPPSLVSPPNLVRLGFHTPAARVLLAAVGLLALVVIVLGWLVAHPSRPKGASSSAAPSPATPSPAMDALWSQLLGQDLTTTVIVPDHTLAMVQEASHRHLDLADYLRRSSEPDDENVRQLEKILRAFSIRRYTTFDAATTAVRVSQLADQFHGKVVVRYARDLTLHELSPGNLVLIGRPLSNLWNQMFESKVNFRFYSDLQRNVISCQNKSPEPGEQAEYLPVDEGAKRIVYASVAFLPNLNNEGNVLIIAGDSSGAQDIAAEFVTDSKLLEGFARKIGRETGPLPHFEALIRTTTLAGVAEEPEVIAYRIFQ
ncbi:MAG TPA: hypothetical protein VI756_27520, partial [Blastocatellia bacterium]